LGEPEISGFHAVGKQDIEKWNNGINLGKISRGSRLFENKG